MLPWQRHFADVALEVDPETGKFAYNEIVLVVPRQSGKSEIVLPYAVHRVSAWPAQRALYMAQTFSDARERWEDVWIARLGDSPLRSLYTTRLRTSAEAILWRNGSTLSPEATTGKSSGTGDTVDVAILDEAWSHNDARVELGTRPAMLTRHRIPPGPQLFVCSMVPGPTRLRTSATSSGYLKEKIKAGRARVAAGVTRDVAYFEWGAPVGSDPADPATWRAAMPAIGFTVLEDTIRADYERIMSGGGMERGDFAAEYLSWWPEDGPAGWLIIPQGSWEAMADPDAQPTGPLKLAVDVNPPQSRASVGVAGAVAGRPGSVFLELVESRDGTSWLPGAVEAFVSRNADIDEVVVVPTGPAGVVKDDLERVLSDARRRGASKAKLRLVSGAEYTTACARFLAGALDRPHWVHLGQPDLDRSVASLDKAQSGKTWVWTRASGSSTDVTGVIAVTLSAWAHETAPQVGAPFMFRG